MKSFAFLTLILLASCTSPPPPLPTPSAQPPIPSPRATDGPALIRCNNAIAHNPAPIAGRPILNAVALPTTLLQVGLTADGKYFAKHGLELLTGKTVDLIVAGDDVGHATIGWNTDTDPTSHIRFPGCREDIVPPDWVAYPGGYSVDEPRCVTLLVRVDGNEAKVDISVGKQCT